MKKIFIQLFTCICITIVTNNLYAGVPEEVISNWDNHKTYESTPEINDDSVSAFIIFNRMYYSYKTEGNITTLEKTIHRKIKVTSATALDDLNKVYVPISGNIFQDNDIIDLNGRCIKKDGSIMEIDTSDIIETTLPANVPFYSNVKGKVKMFAIPGVNIGDEVEYYFTVFYEVANSPKAFETFNSYSFEAPYPCREHNFVITIPDKYNLKSVPRNMDENFTKLNSSDGNTTYSAVLKNYKPLSEESYVPDHRYEKIIYVQIYPASSKEFDANWTEAVNYQIDLTDYSDKLNRYYYATILKNVNKASTFKKKVENLSTEVNKELLKDNNTYELSTKVGIGKYNIGLLKYIAGTQKWDLTLWYVIDKTSSVLINDIYTLSQFDDIIVEFSKDKESYYAPVFKPFDRINEVDYDFNNTAAVKVTFDNKGNSKVFIDTFQIKVSKDSNLIKRNFEFEINPGEETTIEVKEEHAVYGQAKLRYRNSILRTRAFIDYTDWEDEVKETLQDKFNDVNNINITPQTYNPITQTGIRWNISYDYKIPTPGSTFIGLSIAKLQERNSSFFLHCEKRQQSAYLGYPYSVSNTYTFKLKNGKFLINDRINQTISNEIGSLKATITSVSPSEVTITLNYEILVDECSATDWCKFTELENAFDALLQQMIIIQ